MQTQDTQTSEELAHPWKRTADLEALHAFNVTQKELLTYPVVFKQISIQEFQRKGKERKGGRKKKEERKK